MDIVNDTSNLGRALKNAFDKSSTDRRQWELKLVQAIRQYRGEYDPETEKLIDPTRSKVYPKVTRAKVVATVSRLMQLLFPVVEKNWTLEPSPVPAMSEETLKEILNQMGDTSQMTDAQINDMIKVFAETRTQNMSLEIEDQLKELGGTEELSYVQLCKKVITHATKYGIGVLKGPLVHTEKQAGWKRNPMTGAIETYTEDVYRPCFEVVPPWNYYPDSTSTSLYCQDMEFERIVMGRKQLMELADRPGFKKDVILNFVRTYRDGNYKQMSFENDIRAMGENQNVRQGTNKFEVIVGWGLVQCKLLAEAGVDLTSIKPMAAEEGEAPPEWDEADYAEAHVWFLDSTIIKAEINPFLTKLRPYHKFIFEEDDVNLMGEGLPEIMRDSQMGISSAMRMIVDNSAVTAGPMVEVNRALIDLGNDTGKIHPFKVWFRDDEGPLAQYPAVRNIPIQSHIQELLGVYNAFRELSDMETNIHPAMSGDFSNIGSEAFRTSGGASQLLQGASLPFRDTVRNFDQFTISVISSLVDWNMQFSNRDDIQGDHHVIARGADSLMAKEVRATTMDNFIATLRPEEAENVDFRFVVTERAKVRDLPSDKLLLSEEQVQQNRAAQQKAQEQMRLLNNTMVEAQVKEILASAANKLAQAKKHEMGSLEAAQELAHTEAAVLERGSYLKPKEEMPSGQGNRAQSA